MKLDSAEKILEYAIRKEEEAANFYTDLAKRVDVPYMQEVFESFAKEELTHKEKLLGVKEGKRLISADKKIADLKIGDHLVEVEMKPDIGYQDALIIAMKAEKAAFKLYTELAQTTDDANLRELFLSLAQEEAKHKLRFEVEYDDYAYVEN